MTQLKKTPLHPLYGAYGAKTIDFGGWELPVQFSGIVREHEAVRQKAGLFDVSHMGEVRVTGRDALVFLQLLTTNDAAGLEIGQAQYSLMCYPDGGVVDDILVYRLGEAEFMLVLNAANTDKDLDWLRKHAEGEVAIEDISSRTALLALQGPRSETILQPLTNTSLSGLKSFRFVPEAEVAGVSALVSRTGYTGEDGFELYVAAEDAPRLWEALMEAGREHGLTAAGLGARDTLRFEARLPLYGQELNAGITPIEAGLGRFVKPEKGDFIGREVLAEQKQSGAPRGLVGIEMIDRGIPRPHYPVFAQGRKIGEVTTGTQSPTFKTNIGLALIEAEYTAPGTEVEVEIRGKRLRARVVKTPFYSRAAKQTRIKN
jgi:aminomethyltransferase